MLTEKYRQINEEIIMNKRFTPNIDRIKKVKITITSALVISGFVSIGTIYYLKIDMLQTEETISPLTKIYFEYSIYVWPVIYTVAAIIFYKVFTKIIAKKTEEFFEISDKKITHNTLQQQRTFYLNEIESYAVKTPDNKTVIGITLNLKNGERIKIRNYNYDEIIEIFKQINIKDVTVKIDPKHIEGTKEQAINLLKLALYTIVGSIIFVVIAVFILSKF